MSFDYLLLVKYLLGTLTSNEKEEVEQWCLLSAENKRIYTDLVRLRIARNFQQYNTPYSIEQALEKVNFRINNKQRRTITYRLLAGAAVILACFALSYEGYMRLKPESYVSIVVKSGEEVKKLELLDGTIVWLKSGSSLTYPESFSPNKRTISLQGDAFFDVAKKAFPFDIRTNYLNIRVTGTSFEVKTDEQRKNVETTLVDGSISLLDQNKNKVLTMLPGEKVTYSQTKNQYITEQVDVNLCAAWRLNQFVFKNATLREIANALSVKFHVNINIESSSLANHRFRYVMNESESLIDVLRLLSYLAPIAFQIEDKEVFISSTNPKKHSL